MILLILQGKISNPFLQLLNILLDFEFISFEDIYNWALLSIKKKSDFDDLLIDFVSGEKAHPKIIEEKIFERIGEQAIFDNTFDTFIGILHLKYKNEEISLEEAITIANSFCLMYRIKTDNAYFLKKKKIEYELEIQEPLGYMPKIKSEFEEFLVKFKEYDFEKLTK